MVMTLGMKIFAVALAKKATVYLLAKSYGFSRVFRRFAEFNKGRISDRTTQRRLNSKMKYLIRLPNRIAYSMGLISQYPGITKR